MVPGVQNVVPVERALARRSLSRRLDAYETEARRLIDAALAVMRDRATIDPRVQDVVAQARLSNQAFYRHFPSKDALLLAVLADGQQRLVDSLTRRVAAASGPTAGLRAWVAGVMAQARNPDAAAATRPFSANGARLAERFPADMAANRELLLATLRPVIRDLGGDALADTELVHDLALARMNQAVVEGTVPSDDDVEHLAAFCVAGVTRTRRGA